MTKAIDKPLLKSLLGLASVVEVRDPYTGGHLWRVGQFSKILAEKAGLETDAVFLASVSGFLHDLGKIGVPDAILRKPGKLTDEEFAVIKSHPTMGVELLQHHPLADLAIDAVHHHHERFDGHGYPDGLDGQQTSILARIVCITDAFDAMTSTRSYRVGMPIDKALSILTEEKGRQFDGGLVDHFSALHLTDGRIEHIVGHSDHGRKLASCPSCGPIIEVPRSAGAGSTVFCRACGAKGLLHAVGDSFQVEHIGSAKDPSELRPRPEEDVLDEFVEAAPKARSNFFLGRIAESLGF